MNAHGGRFLVGIGLSALVAGCVRAYRPPTADEPHATLKVRRVYEKTGGDRLDETCLLNGHLAVSQSAPVGLAGAPRTDALLIHPIPAKLGVTGSFVHQEMRTVQESYTVQVPDFAIETYNCGTGTSFQTCTRTVTRYRTETRYRTVVKPVDVIDGTCTGELFIAPEVGHAYLVDFTYRDHKVCDATCIEQTPASPEGTFQSRPCPRPTDAEMKGIGG